MKLYELPQRQLVRPKIYGLNPDGHEDGVVEFDHLDGMYSCCVAFDGEGKQLGICHLASYTSLEPYEDGYVIPKEAISDD